MLKARGVDVPKTWADFQEAAKKLTVDSNNDGTPEVYGVAFENNISTDGNSGYVKYKDLMGPQPKTPEEAIAMQEMGEFEKREIPLYAADGKTVIGSFK